MAEEDSSLDDTESHVASDEHDEGNSNEVGILLFEEDEHPIQEDTSIALLLREDKLRKQSV